MLLLDAGILGIFGAFLASFAGVISERLNSGDAWTRGRSRCNACNRTLSVVDLIPVVSYLVVRGRCRMCGARIPVRYLAIEFALGLSFFLGTLEVGLVRALPFLLATFFILAVVVLYDMRHTIVPLPLALLLVFFSGWYAFLAYSASASLGLAFLSAGSIGLAFFLMHLLSRGRFMGLGDAPVALALSLIAGTQALTGLVYSFWVGGAIGILVLVRTKKGHRMGIEVPFVPFLAVGYLLALFTPWNLFPF